MIEIIAIAAVPMILASLGGLFSERAGVLNIALEGCIAAGAFVTVLLIHFGLPIPLAAAAAVASGALFGGFLAYIHLGFGANLFIAGLGLNLLIPSLIDLASQVLLGHKGTIRIAERSLQGWSGIGEPMTAILMIPLAVSAALTLSRTAFGRRIRAAGSSPEFLAERGISPLRTRALALMLSSALAASAGAFLALRVEAWVPGLSAGRGWISLVVIWLGFRRPLGMLIAAYFFSIMDLVSGRAQGLPSASATMYLALPYLTALAALVAASVGTRYRNRRD